MEPFRTLRLIWFFERRAAWRAIIDTWHFYGDNKVRAIVLALSCIVIGSLLQYTVRGKEPMLLELETWVYYVVAPIGALTLALLLWNLLAAPARLFHEQKVRIGQIETERAAALADKGFSLTRQNSLITAIKEHEGANVEVSFANIAHKRLADTLTSIFELAMWETNLNNIQIETYHHGLYVEGIEVRGFNKYLVDFVCDALTKHGLPARPNLQTTQVKRDNTKWPWIQRNIKITIGHH
jgi:hypothetical protein